MQLPIAITMGDAAGIGPEISAKAYQLQPELLQACIVWGDLATNSAINKGVAGIVVDGAVRDTADIRELKFAVWTRSVSSNAGEAKGCGEINQPITIAGQRISPGDWIVADDDGVMVLPRDKAVEMANRAADVLEGENRVRAEIRNNKTTLGKVMNLQRWEKRGGGSVG